MPKFLHVLRPFSAFLFDVLQAARAVTNYFASTLIVVHLAKVSRTICILLASFSSFLFCRVSINFQWSLSIFSFVRECRSLHTKQRCAKQFSRIIFVSISKCKHLLPCSFCFVFRHVIALFDVCRQQRQAVGYKIILQLRQSWDTWRGVS